MKCGVCGKEFKAGETMRTASLDGIPAIVHPLCDPDKKPKPPKKRSQSA